MSSELPADHSLDDLLGAVAPPRGPRLERWSLGWAVATVTLLAFVYRLLLRRSYFGAEEEDYGNLGLILGTLQSGFTYIETQHMPLFTTLAAVVTAATKDAELGGEIVALVSGSLAVGAVVWIGWRWLHPATGLLAGFLFLFHPDAALHAATPLRISTFVLFSLVGVALIGERRPLRGALLLSLAFLTRFETAFTLFPALLLFTAASRKKRDLAGSALLGATVLGWALYYRSAEGTFRFWGDVMSRTTEGALSMLHPETLWGVLIGTLPDHLGNLVALAVPVGLVALALDKSPLRSRRRWLALCTAGVFGFFCLTVLLSSYAPDHNLFWKWSIASTPFLMLCAAHVVVGLLRAVWNQLGVNEARSAKTLVPIGLLCTLALMSVSTDYSRVTRAQLDRSAQWYGTQVRLMEWIEDNYPQDVGLVADNIPATWLSRIANERRVVRWSSSPTEAVRDADDNGPNGVPSGLSAEEFGTWLLDNKLSLVIVFRENNRGSLDKAPWLGELVPQKLGPAQLQPIAREEGYGFIAWQVSGSGAGPHPSSLPPVAAGGVEVVVQE